MWNDTGMETLANCVVRGIYIGEGEELLVFDTDRGPVAFETEADCCSETWFADILGPASLIGQRVVAIEDVPLANYNVGDGRCRQEEDEVYGHRLATAKGYTDIIYRNSSNGYYGGSLCTIAYELIPADDPNLTAITEDWNA